MGLIKSIGLIFFLLLISFGTNYQIQTSPVIEESQRSEIYALVDIVFPNIQNQTFLLNDHFLTDKSWIQFLMNENLFNDLYGHCINEEERKVIGLKDVVESEFYIKASEIVSAQEIESIDFTQIDKHIIKVNACDGSADVEKVFEISKPFIIGDTGIVFVKSQLEENSSLQRK